MLWTHNFPCSGKIWRGFNLAIWQSRKVPIQILPILIPTTPASWLRKYITKYARYHFLRRISVYVFHRKCDIRDSSPSLGRKFMSLMRAWGVLWESKTTALHAVSPQSQAKYEYSLEVRAKMGRYAAKTAWPGLLDTFKWQTIVRLTS